MYYIDFLGDHSPYTWYYPTLFGLQFYFFIALLPPKKDFLIYRLRVILDVEEDVLRDLEIAATASLENLHDAITQAFGFGSNEMACFYRSSQNGNKEKSFPGRYGDPTATPMGNTPLEELLTESTPQLLYVYDFLSLWTFFIELVEVAEPEPAKGYPNLLFAQGEVPEEAPENNLKLKHLTKTTGTIKMVKTFRRKTTSI